MTAKKKATTSKKATKSGEVWALTVFLLKSGIKSFKDALHKNAQASGTQLIAVSNIGELAIKRSSAVQPGWARQLSVLVPAVAALRQQSPGAILFVRAGGEKFAVTFGYGRSLLAPAAIVHDFGIRVVLNSLNPDLIRSLDSRTLDSSPQLSRKQFIDGRPLAAFAMDRMHELLKGVTGRVKKNAVTRFEGELVTGTDSLHCRVRIGSPIDLVTHCSEFFKLYNKTDYKTDFSFIDHVRLVRDPVATKDLDARLLAKAKSKSAVKDFGFAPPRLLTGEELGRMRCAWDRSIPDEEIDAEIVRERLLEHADKSANSQAFIERLKRDRVELFDAAGNTTESWSLYNCLLIEIKAQKLCVLTTGDWYAANEDFVKQVSGKFDNMTSSSALNCPIRLPKQQKNERREDQYNRSAATQLNLELFDKTSLTTGTGASGVEPCDLLDAKVAAFIHVKVGRRSSDLSHLFNQGLVATFTFLDEPRARENVRQRAATKKAPFLQEPIKASNLTTVFAIIDKPPAKRKAWRLPFFSMVVASNVAERIAQRGVQVYTVRVDAA